MSEHFAFWPEFEPVIEPMLGEDDDPALWAVALDTIFADARALIGPASGLGCIFAKIGRCSHWLRPHQCRWTADGGFAWPSGYGGVGFSRTGLPEFDWSAQWAWCPNSQGWTFRPNRPLPRDLVFRVVIPSRTRRRRQAAVHTIWRPGPPPSPRAEVMQFYGFRRRTGKWLCTAYRSHPTQRAYEAAVGS
jgi:hypothetical protein